MTPFTHGGAHDWVSSRVNHHSSSSSNRGRKGATWGMWHGTGCQRASATLAVSHKAHHLLRLVHKWIIIILNLIFSPSQDEAMARRRNCADCAKVSMTSWRLRFVGVSSEKERARRLLRYGKGKVDKPGEGVYWVPLCIPCSVFRDFLIKFCAKQNKRNDSSWAYK